MTSKDSKEEVSEISEINGIEIPLCTPEELDILFSAPLTKPIQITRTPINKDTSLFVLTETCWDWEGHSDTRVKSIFLNKEEGMNAMIKLAEKAFMYIINSFNEEEEEEENIIKIDMKEIQEILDNRFGDKVIDGTQLEYFVNDREACVYRCLADNRNEYYHIAYTLNGSKLTMK